MRTPRLRFCHAGKGINRRRAICASSQGELWAKTVGEGAKAFEVETPVASCLGERGRNLISSTTRRPELLTIEGVVQFGTAFGTCPIRTNTISYGVRREKVHEAGSDGSESSDGLDQ